ncbi:MAG: TAT-variant-translocated molybdopterin oxidoreductase [Flavobacteriaceae bacterium]|nr:TAT-variant-translocated molybdopterin oxidoreductase [Bacteroidia bacterium]MBT8286982.1 TAT-variant-translocated molybdopterin oxidoreductase [Bacteroidia bacterium]NNF75049.1 TAT-variant-translocated molybdopterin oxidoreductase [Flavobacteriaceae bacterium]NNK73426.1 TAT-variant-translocated molybdopterin oxidoreductase [Flavobacteriaceae bacterium]
MSSNKKYWKSIEELNPDNGAAVEALKHKEFVQEIPVDEFLGDKDKLETSSTSRRDFLKYVGFSTAAASLAACEGPVIRSIPYVVQPEQIIPGVANYYATAIANGYDFANILIKTREGRPIKVENNKLAKTHGHSNARVQASVLDLYDSYRVVAPMKDGAESSWIELEGDLKSKLVELQGGGKDIVLLTQTFASPSTAKLIEEFKAKYGNVRHVVYDAISESAALDAFESKYGERALANYNFSEASAIVSFGADILGDWQGGGYDTGYAKSRIPSEGKMSMHFQFESNMTITGAKADKRVPLKPSELKVALAKLYGKIAGTAVSGSLPENVEEAIDKAASVLRRAGSKAVVVAGISDVDAQLLALEINEMLGSDIMDTDHTVKTRQGNDKEVNQLITDMKSGTVGALIMCGVNPAYTLANGSDFVEGLANTEMSITFTMKADETAVNCNYIASLPHYLESWGDVEFVKGHYGLVQPTIRPLFDTKQFQDVLLGLIDFDGTYHDYIKSNWEADILNGSSFNQALHDGVFVSGSDEMIVESTIEEDATVALVSASDAARRLAATVGSGMELTLYPKIGMGDGQQANNPWLQEFPDPLTRTTWDNYLTISEGDAKELGLYLERSTFFSESSHDATGGLNGKYANITVNGITITAPVIIQPGQAKGSVGLSLGYGREEGVKNEMKTGVNAYPFYSDFNTTQSVTIEVAEGKHEFACVQLHNTLMGRGDVIRETDLVTHNTKDKEEWNPVTKVSLEHKETPVSSPKVDLWDEFDRSIGHHFNLSIDLNACTGCGSCIIACHAENNVPVVGKEEIRRSRDMHWLRIDRYYSSEATFEADNEKKDNIKGVGSSMQEFGEMESPAANPQVAFQPIMCQHCNHAPCETVCPVAATSHGRQGQNHMAYNRCVGTRYCANNCPYKVRRFNWFLYNANDEFDFHMNDDLGRMVINPDVTVRSRGVMEKCSLCIQRTQKTILDAKRDGREIEPNEFETACSAACGSGALVFGDINNKKDEVAHLIEDSRAYRLLEGVGTKPNVVYQALIRNTDEV